MKFAILLSLAGLTYAAPTYLNNNLTSATDDTASLARRKAGDVLRLTNKSTNGPVANITDMGAISDWKYCAQFVAAVYCHPDTVTDWDCGEHCQGDLQVLYQGGDNDAAPLHYVATTGQAVVFSIAGVNKRSKTSTSNVKNYALMTPDKALFPDSGGIKVHRGIYGVFKDILSAVDPIIQDQVKGGTKEVLLVGHSLGGAISELMATYFARLYGDSVKVSARTFALPRVGNPAWANYVDASFAEDGYQWISKSRDPVVHLPPKILGFRHPHNEVHIPKDHPNVMLACSGQENSKCSGQYDNPVSIYNGWQEWKQFGIHTGPFAGIQFKTGCKRLYHE